MITQSSPSRTARVRSWATSEPVSGSVTAIEVTAVPAMAGARNRRFSSSDPNSCSDGVAIIAWTPMAIPTPPACIRPYSSAATSWKLWSAPSPP